MCIALSQILESFHRNFKACEHAGSLGGLQALSAEHGTAGYYGGGLRVWQSNVNGMGGDFIL